jgi:hypothetical protein
VLCCWTASITHPIPLSAANRSRLKLSVYGTPPTYHQRFLNVRLQFKFITDCYELPKTGQQSLYLINIPKMFGCKPNIMCFDHFFKFFIVNSSQKVALLHKVEGLSPGTICTQGCSAVGHLYVLKRKAGKKN